METAAESDIITSGSGFNRALLALLAAHYLTPNTTARAPETGQFSLLTPLREASRHSQQIVTEKGGSKVRAEERVLVIIHHILSLLFFFPCSLYPFFLFFIPLLCELLISLKMCQFDSGRTKPPMICVKRLRERKESEAPSERQFQGSESSINLT